MVLSVDAVGLLFVGLGLVLSVAADHGPVLDDILVCAILAGDVLVSIIFPFNIVLVVIASQIIDDLLIVQQW